MPYDNSLLDTINTFPASPLVTVPASLLQELIGAVQELKDEVAALREENDRGRAEVAALCSKVASLESLQEQDTTRILLDVAEDRRRLSALEHPHKEPGKTETARAEKIERYIAARPDHKATFETLKGHLGIDNDLLGIAVRSLLHSGRFAIIKTPGDKRKRTLVMLPR